jgi:sugar phosphate isomerase/epimerase
MTALRTGHPLGVCCKKGNDWLGFLAGLSGHGFEHIELNIADESPGSRVYDPLYCQQVRRLIDELGMSVSLHCMEGINLGEKVSRLRAVSMDIVCEAVELAEVLGAAWLTLHLGAAGISNAQPDRKRARLELVADTLEQILARTAGSKVVLGLENLPRIPPGHAMSRLGDCAEEFAIMLARLTSPRIGVVFDVGHARINRLADRQLRDFMSVIGARAVGVHLHWNDEVEDLHAPLHIQARNELSGHLDAIGAELAPSAAVLLECHSLAENLASARVLRELGALRDGERYPRAAPSTSPSLATS